MRAVWFELRESNASKGLREIVRSAKLGLLPVLVVGILYMCYSCYAGLREALGGAVFIEDKNFVVMVAGVLLVGGVLSMTLVGFVRARGYLGLSFKTMFLFGFGLLVPLAAAYVQYEWYLTSPESFAFDEAALASVGQDHTAESIAAMRREISRLADFRAILERSITAISARATVSYLDSLAEWNAEGCRRLDLGALSDHVCVVKDEIYIPHAGMSVSYWLVLRREGSRSEPDDLLQLDFFLLTGDFTCPVPNDFTGGGGLNFLRHEILDSSKVGACLGAASGALASRVRGLMQSEARFRGNIFMPRWYFFAASVMTFVGSDLAFVQPLGLPPVALSVLLAVFRFFYFAVVVTLLLEPATRLRSDL